MQLKSLFASSTLIAGLAGSVHAAEVELRLAHWVPPTHPAQTAGIEPWVASLKEASNGRIDVQIFPAQQLGSAPDHYDMTRDGIADIGWVNPGYQAGRFPIYSLVEIPFHMDNAPRGARAMHEWYMAYAETEMQGVKFCLANPHDPGTFHSKEPIVEPGDVKGKNVRPAHATMARFVSLLGGGPVQVSAPEAREAIAKGAADAITFPWGSTWIFGIDKETKHHLDVPLYVSAQALLINQDTYNGMPDDLKAILDAHCTPKWSEKFSAGWAEAEASGRDKAMADSSHTLHTLNEAQTAAWQEAAAPLLDSWKSDVADKGVDADAVYQSYADKLKEHDAHF